jgi:hypothetical protein
MSGGSALRLSGVNPSGPSQSLNARKPKPGWEKRRAQEKEGVCLNRSNAIVLIGVLGEEGAIVLCADERPRVAGERDDWKRAEDGVDGAALEAEFAQVPAGQERARRVEEYHGRRAGAQAAPASTINR